jgi:rubredoxin
MSHQFRAESATGPKSKRIDMKKWQCIVCGFIYDEAEGIPDEGIAPGTAWGDIPDTWECPDCGATKDDFEMVVL